MKFEKDINGHVIKKYRIKKDVVVYHPHLLILLKGTVVLSTMEPIIGENGVIFTKREDIDQYLEEIVGPINIV